MRLFLITILLLIRIVAVSQTAYPDTLNKKRLFWVAGSEVVLYSASMVGLYQLWYSGYDMKKFHFFNDNNGWLGMDKMGHTMTSYYVGRLGYGALRFSGVSENKATWYGGTLGLFYLTSVEIFDGFSEEWGASPGDLIANTSGTAIFIAQQKLWHEQRITLKFSSHLSDYAKIRPDHLGRNYIERTLKDYNGQTYWLSGNISSFLKENTRFPSWLSLSIGYSGNGMVGGDDNIWDDENGYEIDRSDIRRYSQFYIAPDIDLTKIKTKSKTLNYMFNLIGFIKFPLPAIEFNAVNGIKTHLIYF